MCSSVSSSLAVLTKIQTRLCYLFHFVFTFIQPGSPVKIINVFYKVDLASVLPYKTKDNTKKYIHRKKTHK